MWVPFVNGGYEFHDLESFKKLMHNENYSIK